MLPFLDPNVALADPRPFVGYTDNTNLLNWLGNLGIVGYHGGAPRPTRGLHPVSAGSLRC